MARTKKPMETYLGRPWELTGRPKTMFDLIEERKARRAQDREDARPAADAADHAEVEA